MNLYHNKYRIEPNRWQFWNYSAPGRYFLTICIENRECILGYVVSGKMELSEFGEIVKAEIQKIPQYNQRVILDEWVVMPNHIHLLIELGDYHYNNGIANVDDNAFNNKNDNSPCGHGHGRDDGDGDGCGHDGNGGYHGNDDGHGCDDGDADGDGCGDGDADGDGDDGNGGYHGNDDGHGCGDGDADGGYHGNDDGHGCGDADGDGCGDGDADGDGCGDGYADGDGCGDDDADGGGVEKIHEFSLPSPPNHKTKQYRKMRRNMLIPKILGKLQMQTSKRINVLRNTPGQKNWQRDFHDHVIRNNISYQRIKNYIANNPKKWKGDKFFNTDAP